jgi:hypothetical protein
MAIHLLTVIQVKAAVDAFFDEFRPVGGVRCGNSPPGSVELIPWIGAHAAI